MEREIYLEQFRVRSTSYFHHAILLLAKKNDVVDIKLA